jgi:toxin ParE1/3/4
MPKAVYEQILLTRRAKADLKSIAKFTEKRWGREQRCIYIKQFDDTFHVLSDTPEIGNNCDYIKENYCNGLITL